MRHKQSPAVTEGSVSSQSVTGTISLAHFGQVTLLCPENGRSSVATMTTTTVAMRSAVGSAVIVGSAAAVAAVVYSPVSPAARVVMLVSSVMSAVVRRPLCAVPISGNMATTAGAMRIVNRRPRHAVLSWSVHTVAPDIIAPPTAHEIPPKATSWAVSAGRMDNGSR